MLLCEKCAKKNAHAGFVEINFADLQNFLVDSERYAIGRMSYYPPVVMELLRKYKKYMTEKTVDTITRDISRWMEGTHTGLEFEQEWDALRRELSEMKRQEAQNGD